jgi:hypothetical protein
MSVYRLEQPAADFAAINSLMTSLKAGEAAQT